MGVPVRGAINGLSQASFRAEVSVPVELPHEAEFHHGNRSLVSIASKASQPKFALIRI